MNKKASHVGMIISFVIFITFIVFLYTVVNPAVSTGQGKETTVGYIDAKIKENVSANLTIASVQIDSEINPVGQKCIELQGFFPLLGTIVNVVKNETNNIQEAYINSVNLIIIRKDGTNIFFRVYASPKLDRLEEKAMDCFPMDSERYYSLGSTTTTRYIFEKEMYRFIDYYNADYDKLKREFKISPGTEFGFDFIQSNETIIKIGTPPSTANVFAEEIPVRYVDNQANILSGFINIKVW